MIFNVQSAGTRDVYIDVEHIVRFFQAPGDPNQPTIVTTDQTQQTCAIMICDLERLVKEAW